MHLNWSLLIAFINKGTWEYVSHYLYKEILNCIFGLPYILIFSSAHLRSSSYILEIVVLFSTQKWAFPDETKSTAVAGAVCFQDNVCQALSLKAVCNYTVFLLSLKIAVHHGESCNSLIYEIKEPEGWFQCDKKNPCSSTFIFVYNYLQGCSMTYHISSQCSAKSVVYVCACVCVCTHSHRYILLLWCSRI